MSRRAKLRKARASEGLDLASVIHLSELAEIEEDRDVEAFRSVL